MIDHIDETEEGIVKILKKRRYTIINIAFYTNIYKIQIPIVRAVLEVEASAPPLEMLA